MMWGKGKDYELINRPLSYIIFMLSCFIYILYIYYIILYYIKKKKIDYIINYIILKKKSLSSES